MASASLLLYTKSAKLILLVFLFTCTIIALWIHKSGLNIYSNRVRKLAIVSQRGGISKTTTVSTAGTRATVTRASNANKLVELTNRSSSTFVNEVRESRFKQIYAATESWINFDKLTFQNCEYKNCQSSSVRQGGLHILYLSQTDIAVFEFFRFKSLPSLDFQTRQRQLWAVVSHECYAYEYHWWKPIVNGQFNLSMTFRQDSEFFYPFGRSVELSAKAQRKVKPRNYADGKIRGAFAYVSHCQSRNYDRLGLMEALRKYTDVDIFGGCTGKQPCSTKVDKLCESEKHKQYRFFLSFENSLCKDYITEKFWNRLASDAIFLPVVVGGTSIREYTLVAPPNSFIHAYNFSSVEALGKYLQYLLANDTAYNKYHTWRRKYEIYTSTNQMISCKLCELANRKPSMQPKPDLKEWWDSGPVGHLPYEIR